MEGRSTGKGVIECNGKGSRLRLHDDAMRREPIIHERSTRAREIQALLECLKNLDLPSGKILTLSLEDTFVLEGKTILLIPLYRWLHPDSV